MIQLKKLLFESGSIITAILPASPPSYVDLYDATNNYYITYNEGEDQISTPLSSSWEGYIQSTAPTSNKNQWEQYYKDNINSVKTTWYFLPKNKGGAGQTSGAAQQAFSVDPKNTGTGECAQGQTKYDPDQTYCEPIRYRNGGCDLGINPNNLDADDFQMDPNNKNLCIPKPGLMARGLAWFLDNWMWAVPLFIGVRYAAVATGKGYITRKSAETTWKSKDNPTLVNTVEAARWQEIERKYKTSGAQSKFALSFPWMRIGWEFTVKKSGLLAKQAKAAKTVAEKEQFQKDFAKIKQDGIVTDHIQSLVNTSKNEYMTMCARAEGKSVSELTTMEQQSLTSAWNAFQKASKGMKEQLGKEAIKIAEMGYLSVTQARLLYGSKLLNREITYGGITTNLDAIIAELERKNRANDTFKGFQEFVDTLK